MDVLRVLDLTIPGRFFIIPDAGPGWLGCDDKFINVATLDIQDTLPPAVYHNDDTLSEIYTNIRTIGSKVAVSHIEGNDGKAMVDIAKELSQQFLDIVEEVKTHVEKMLPEEVDENKDIADYVTKHGGWHTFFGVDDYDWFIIQAQQEEESKDVKTREDVIKVIRDESDPDENDIKGMELVADLYKEIFKLVAYIYSNDNIYSSIIDSTGTYDKPMITVPFVQSGFIDIFNDNVVDLTPCYIVVPAIFVHEPGKPMEVVQSAIVMCLDDTPVDYKEVIDDSTNNLYTAYTTTMIHLSEAPAGWANIVWFGHFNKFINPVILYIQDNPPPNSIPATDEILQGIFDEMCALLRIVFKDGPRWKLNDLDKLKFKLNDRIKYTLRRVDELKGPSSMDEWADYFESFNYKESLVDDDTGTISILYRLFVYMKLHDDLFTSNDARGEYATRIIPFVKGGCINVSPHDIPEFDPCYILLPAIVSWRTGEVPYIVQPALVVGIDHFFEVNLNELLEGATQRMQDFYHATPEMTETVDEDYIYFVHEKIRQSINDLFKSYLNDATDLEISQFITGIKDITEICTDIINQYQPNDRWQIVFMSYKTVLKPKIDEKLSTTILYGLDGPNLDNLIEHLCILLVLITMFDIEVDPVVEYPIGFDADRYVDITGENLPLKTPCYIVLPSIKKPKVRGLVIYRRSAKPNMNGPLDANLLLIGKLDILCYLDKVYAAMDAKGLNIEDDWKNRWKECVETNLLPIFTSEGGDSSIKKSRPLYIGIVQMVKDQLLIIAAAISGCNDPPQEMVDDVDACISLTLSKSHLNGWFGMPNGKADDSKIHALMDKIDALNAQKE